MDYFFHVQKKQQDGRNVWEHLKKGWVIKGRFRKWSDRCMLFCEIERFHIIIQKFIEVYYFYESVWVGHLSFWGKFLDVAVWYMPFFRFGILIVAETINAN